MTNDPKKTPDPLSSLRLNSYFKLATNILLFMWLPVSAIVIYGIFIGHLRGSTYGMVAIKLFFAIFPLTIFLYHYFNKLALLSIISQVAMAMLLLLLMYYIYLLNGYAALISLSVIVIIHLITLILTLKSSYGGDERSRISLVRGKEKSVPYAD